MKYFKKLRMYREIISDQNEEIESFKQRLSLQLAIDGFKDDLIRTADLLLKAKDDYIIYLEGKRS